MDYFLEKLPFPPWGTLVSKGIEIYLILFTESFFKVVGKAGYRLQYTYIKIAVHKKNAN